MLNSTEKNSKVKTLFMLVCLFLSMLLLSFASSPIYDLFCKATGYGGTTQNISLDNFNSSMINNNIKSKKEIIVYFDANIDKKMGLKFRPLNKSITLKLGEVGIVFYEIENTTSQDKIATAIYNASPDNSGIYFVKVHCFCFEEQIIKAKERRILPVAFFISPELEKDSNTRHINEITLSYVFYSSLPAKYLKELN
ncbi:MAG TPA: cytochrome c oxidase assembly protein [Candidatus Megaira endosymbiont of Hartmannula sinica]|nr:cytochrome c oxidase assembly protein [Candidatus Megaera endosymbiont of Hartmannula sinica]